ncbi:MAG: hypothetical protein BEN18_06465 [Epulopiscium sp. Nuni2H_MBin001]|nr:MAG: hypothetical protein BEN18_06465 [Epulopiscium sp. Nuni2H_MBin001]
MNELKQSQEVMILIMNFKGKILSANGYATERLGYTKSEFQQKHINELAIDTGSINEFLNNVIAVKNKNSVDLTLQTLAGDRIYTICTVESNKEKETIELSAIDVKKYNLIQGNSKYIKKLHSDLEQAEELLQEHYNTVVDEISKYDDIIDYIKIINEDNTIAICQYDLPNDHICLLKSTTAFKNVLGLYGEHENLKLNVNAFDTETIEKITEYQDLAIDAKGYEYGLECKYNHPSKGWIWIYLIVKYYQTAKSDTLNILVALADINAEKQIEEKMINTLYDPLTKAPNKDYFLSYFREHNEKNHMAVIYFDLDNFKFVNDSFGRKYGDETLKQVVSRLKNIEWKNFIVGRLIADEFIIVLEDVESLDEVHIFMDKVTQVFAKPFTVQTVNFGLSYSAGISMYPNDSLDFEELCNNADIAMHKVKAEGKKKYMFYHKNFKEDVVARMYMESDLREGLKNSEFSLYYQPQVNMSNNKVQGFEALIRWIKPDGRIIPPFKFITSAEETGLMVPIGAWVIKEACEFINRLAAGGYPNLYVAVNISGVQIADPNFVNTVNEILDETDVNTYNLHMEITETILMKDMKTNTEKIRCLQSRGVIIALDDFGTGYSSLTYLKQFPVDVLKIEKTFVDDIGTDRKNLVGSIINLGHDLDLAVVAEGVEEAVQLDYLEAYNCDVLQGYIVSRPMPEENVWEFLKESY